MSLSESVSPTGEFWLAVTVSPCFGESGGVAAEVWFASIIIVGRVRGEGASGREECGVRGCAGEKQGSLCCTSIIMTGCQASAAQKMSVCNIAKGKNIY